MSYLSQEERDIGRIVAASRANTERLGLMPVIGGFYSGANLNSANTDHIILIQSPAPHWRITKVTVKNRGTTASITTATAGVFTASGGGGTALASDQALSALTQNTVNTVAALMDMTLTNTTQWMNLTELYFRVGTAQGAAATADVYIFIEPLPSL